MAAVIEYLIAEICEVAGTVCLEQGKKIMFPRHIELGVRTDPDLGFLFKNKCFRGGGVTPFVDSRLLKK